MASLLMVLGLVQCRSTMQMLSFCLRILLVTCSMHAVYGAGALDCWDGTAWTYDVCCGCGNEWGNRSGIDACWGGDFAFEDCCTAYGSAKVLPNLPCWRDALGPKLIVELAKFGGISWKLPQRPVPPYDVGSVMPYVLWPSAYAIAVWLFDMPAARIRGQRVIELGCGLALPSMVAALAGAAALATDIDDKAVHLANLAARSNLPPDVFSRFRAQTLDFRNTEAVASLGIFDIVLIAGQLYSKALQQPLLEALRLLCGSRSAPHDVDVAAEGPKHSCSIVLAVGGSRQLSPDLWHGWPVALEFLHALELEIGASEFFLCNKRGYTAPWSGYACVLFES
ncbi:unnamed protein product [Polarella glacialis]|uniref:Calmodulin-lysine N-methyltransferase n=1 Tax=Polarella glacialis TaxID=89957 RepID=A0A813FBL5_POLGL|nr:unnamed protein product [Polarella glacialis]